MASRGEHLVRADRRFVTGGGWIGRLAEGYEADFLVLEADPLVDFANTARIRSRVKQGQPLEIAP